MEKIKNAKTDQQGGSNAKGPFFKKHKSPGSGHRGYNGKLRFNFPPKSCGGIFLVMFEGFLKEFFQVIVR
ncbi:MAG: hypothetical protein IPH04_11145 [Saprospirales bacterium]|nr:hypothetical protein [Saprospirales bacterium]